MLPRFSNLRRNHIAKMARNPRSRPRHERCDISQFTTKEEEDYLDVYQDSGGANKYFVLPGWGGLNLC